MDNETIFTDEELSDIAFGVAPKGWRLVRHIEMIDKKRWSNVYGTILKRENWPSEVFYEVTWSQGATEYQNQGPEDFSCHRVYPHEVTTIEYRTTP